jgi:hypothetical protein
MNTLQRYVVLFVVGIVLSYISDGNIVVTILGCLILGFIMNRKGGGAQSARTSVGVVTSGSLGCPKCAARVPIGDLYCRKCGSRIPQAATSQPASKVEYDPYDTGIRLDVIAERDYSDYVSLVQDLVMVDSEGRHWSRNPEAHTWSLYEGGVWVPDEPTGALRIVRGGDRLLKNIHQAPRIAEQKKKKKKRKPARVCAFCNTACAPSDVFCTNCGRRLP